MASLDVGPGRVSWVVFGHTVEPRYCKGCAISGSPDPPHDPRRARTSGGGVLVAKTYDALDERLIAFIKAQKMFFVATAPLSAEGSVNVSPKGYDSLAVIDERTVAYVDLEVAWVGLTEDEAKAKGIKVKKGLFPWTASGRAIANGRDEGFTKLLFDDSPEAHGHGRILGGGIVGTHA
eukprot:gene49197-66799_t